MRARARASHSCSSVASGFTRARLSRIDSWNRCPSWVTIPMVSRSEAKVASRTSVPPIRTAPEVTS